MCFARWVALQIESLAFTGPVSTADKVGKRHANRKGNFGMFDRGLGRERKMRL